MNMNLPQRRELRLEMRRVLENLDPRWVKVASLEICRNLSGLLASKFNSEIEHVLAWVSFFPGEADLSAFVSDQLGRKRVYLPQSLPDATMRFLSVGDGWLDEMERGSFGIPEPDNTGELYDTENAASTLVLVPGLAFDSDGNRLGRGKGHYDRFLGRSVMMKATLVGICWDLQLVERLRIESHDVPVHYIVHEEGILDIRGGAA